MDRIRTGLRTDYGQPIGAARLARSIPVALDPDCSTGYSLPAAQADPDPDPGGYFPRFTLRSRSRRYTDDDGVVRWAWATFYAGQVVQRELRRTEISDTAGHTRITAILDVPVPDSEDVEPPQETMTAWDENGHGWSVTKLDDQGNVWVLTIERVDDGTD